MSPSKASGSSEPTGRHGAFKDHFSAHAASYRHYRPRYPADLFVWLAAQCGAHRLAWDCATGNGQAAEGLVPHFDRVHASDASAEQIEQAQPHSQIDYRVERAERCSLGDGSADLICVAQAFHWFDHEAFLSEVERVLAPGGVLAVWTYTLFAVDTTVDDLIKAFAYTELGPWWPPERAYVNDGYAGLPLPFDPLTAPQFAMAAHWECGELLQYLSTWSAVRRCAGDTGVDPLRAFAPRLEKAWGNAGRRTVKWPLVMRATHRPV